MRFLRAKLVTSLPGGPGITGSGDAVCANANCQMTAAMPRRHYEPARQVPGLSANDGAGNARILLFA